MIVKRKKPSEMFAFYHPFRFMCGNEETLGAAHRQEEGKKTVKIPLELHR